MSQHTVTTGAVSGTVAISAISLVVCASPHEQVGGREGAGLDLTPVVRSWECSPTTYSKAEGTGGFWERSWGLTSHLSLRMEVPVISEAEGSVREGKTA